MAAIRSASPSVNGWSADYLEQQYTRFKTDPSGMPEDLRSFFTGFDLAVDRGSSRGVPTAAAPSAESHKDAIRLHVGVTSLVDAYRRHGHECARTDPFGRESPHPACLSLSYHNLSERDLDVQTPTFGLPLGSAATLRSLIAALEKTYCRTIGIEFMHATSDAERQWWLERFEQRGGVIPLTSAQRIQTLERLVRAELMEVFLQNRYPGDKRFSLEGGESTIPLMDRCIEAASELGVEEVMIGASHRGRVNMLNNILGKTYEQIFTEFEDNFEEDFADGGGDVKYHRGYSGERTLPNGRTIKLAMASNPSHLESVGGVVLGRCRAKQRLRNDTARTRVIPMLVHGDAAVIGQGVVAELLNLTQLEGYTVGGMIHIVINNLVGFTTGPEDARSSRYCTDIGLMGSCPVLHVNGEDPEACVACAQWAIEYRQAFKRDIFIDLICFRKYGHNEQDEASFTQPILAGLVKRKAGTMHVYAERLLAEGIISESDMTSIRDRLSLMLESAQAAARSTPTGPTIDAGSHRWQGFNKAYSHDVVETGVPESALKEVCAALAKTPAGFNVNAKLVKTLANRGALPASRDITYADAESLAFGTLLLDGHGVRLSGQDARRGTFSHRHAVLRDAQTGEPYTPLNNMRPIADLPDNAGKVGSDGRLTQGRFCVYDSPLSEASVMAFDYGYSLADPRMLVMWEAQFGDFCNGAQVIIDQYLASAEIKWDRWSGLVLLLPHGYEGAGPEHSSARLERFLALCANDNMEVVHPSTAAQIFHVLRRQVKRPFRKPLIIMTPKSMLREVTSRFDDLLPGTHFHEVIDDPAFAKKGAQTGAVERILLCSGKFFHELAAKRDAYGLRDLALLRVEQLYPFNASLLKQTLARYPNAVSYAWAQEEPRNAGAFMFMADVIRSELGLNLEYLGRPASATPAVGSKSAHKKQAKSLLHDVFGDHDETTGRSSGSAGGKPTMTAKRK